VANGSCLRDDDVLEGAGAIIWKRPEIFSLFVPAIVDAAGCHVVRYSEPVLFSDD
jgi:hypothetical protein